MKLTRTMLGTVAILAYLGFITGAKNLASSPLRMTDVEGSVVLPPTLQAVLYLGDKYLAANIESMRVLATGGDLNHIQSDYFQRLHTGVALLNPCHEDNYYIANALLAWAGQVDPALIILSEASQCRFWDDVPAFFLGYSLYFFKHQPHAGRAWLNTAAARSVENRAAYQRFGILMESETYPDVKAARRFLSLQREQAHDPKLRQLLAQRMSRLDGLIVLQDAQAAFERRYGEKLENPMDLLNRKILPQFPMDPMKLGYEFSNGQFYLKEFRIRGVAR